jgi:hypothetical protein
MKKETVIEIYYTLLETAHFATHYELFTENATINCPVYGFAKIPHFLKAFFNDSITIKIILEKITMDPKDQDIFIVHFGFTWALKNGQTVTGNGVNIINFDSHNKIICIDGTPKLTELVDE